MRTVSENEAELVARSPAPDTTDVTSGQSDCFILCSEITLSFRPLNWLSEIPWKAITWHLLNLFVELLIYVHVKIRSKYAVKYKVGKSAVYMSCKNNSTLFFGSDEYLNVVNCMSLVEVRQNSVDTDE